MKNKELLEKVLIAQGETMIVTIEVKTKDGIVREHDVELPFSHDVTKLTREAKKTVSYNYEPSAVLKLVGIRES